MAAVVHQRIDRLLQHALLVPDDDLRRAQLKQILQAVVAVDDATVEVVQVARRKPAAFERNQRTQIRRNDRQNGQNHPLRTRIAAHESFHETQPLGQLLANRLVAGSLEADLEFGLQHRQVDALQQRLDRRGAHVGHESVAVIVHRLAVFDLVHGLADLERRIARIGHDVLFIVDHVLERLRGHVEHQADAARHALEEPDVRNRHGQLDMAHALAAHLGLGHFHAAAVADDPLVFHTLVFAAVALPVAGGSENAFAEETALFRLETAVIDGLGVLDLAERPRTDHFRRRNVDRNRTE